MAADGAFTGISTVDLDSRRLEGCLRIGHQRGQDGQNPLGCSSLTAISTLLSRNSCGKTISRCRAHACILMPASSARHPYPCRKRSPTTPARARSASRPATPPGIGTFPARGNARCGRPTRQVSECQVTADQVDSQVSVPVSVWHGVMSGSGQRSRAFWEAEIMVDQLEDRIASFQTCIESRDREAAEDVLHPQYALVLVQPVRAVMSRTRWLEVLPDYVVHSYCVEERVVDLDGDVAAVIHRAEMEATVLGEDRSGLFVISDLWRRTEGQWQVWRRHSTPLRAGPMPGAG